MAEKKPKVFKPELTVDDILGLYRMRYNDGDESRMRWISTEMRGLCRLDKEPRIPKQYQAITKTVKTPFIRDAAHRISSSLLAKEPIVHITPKSTERKEYRQAASICERADMALKEYLNKERGQDIDYNLTYQLVRDGGSVLKVVHRPDAWANFPARTSDSESADSLIEKQEDFKKGAVLPFLWKDVDRQSIVYENGEYGDEWVIEYGEYSVPFLKNRYEMVEQRGKLVNPRKPLEGSPMPEGLKTSATGVTVKVEFFNSREWHVIIDGAEAPGFPKANPYAPCLPYFRARAYDEESLLYSLLFLVPRLDELLTMQLNWAYLGAYPVPVLGWAQNMQAVDSYVAPTGNPGDSVTSPPANNPKRVTFEPGKLFDTPWGRELRFLNVPPVGADVDRLVAIFKALIDTAGIPSIMRGISGSGDSGYLANQLRASAQMAFKLAATSLQRQQEKAYEFTHWMVSNVVRQTVYVLGWDKLNSKTKRPTEKSKETWIGIAPEGSLSKKDDKNIADLSKIAVVGVKYRSKLPTDEQSMAMIALQVTNAPRPLYDQKTALETFMQEEDPDSIIDRIWVEKAESEGPLQQMAIDAALRDADILPKKEPAPPTASPPPAALAAMLAAQGGAGPVPPGAALPPGAANVPGLNAPVSPPEPSDRLRVRGIPGHAGGRPAGSYPGLPSGPNQEARTEE